MAPYPASVMTVPAARLAELATAGSHASSAAQEWTAAVAFLVVLSLLAAGAALAIWIFQTQDRKRKAIEDALRWNRTKLNLALRSAKVSTWTWNRETDVSETDEYLPKLFGFDKLPGGLKTFQGLVVPEDWPKLAAILASCQYVGAEVDTEFRIRWPDGSLHHLAVRGQVFADDQGKPNRLTGICQDITERRMAEEALLQSRHQLSMAAQSAHIGMWEWDIINDRVKWDDTMHALFNTGPNDFSGDYKAFASFLHPDDQVRVQAELARCFHDGSDFDTEYRVISPQGMTRTLAAKGRVYRNDAGKPSHMTGICVDLSRQKQAEDQLRATATALEKSNKELELFAYAASHDLQEPVRAVSGCAELLQRRYGSQLDDNGHELLKHVLDGATRMRTLISDLLTYSRVGGPKAKPFTKVELDAVWQGVLANLRVTIAETQAKVAHDPPLPTVKGDATQLGQLFQNLVSNALKYRSEAPPEVHLSAQREGDYWHFIISDNGIGIEPQYFERIFILFQRLHTRTHYPGTGIGLTMCKKIVELHGGHIWVESEPGHGSKFHFTIPYIH